MILRSKHSVVKTLPTYYFLCADLHMCSRLNSFCQKFGQLALALLGTVGVWDYRAMGL